MVMFDSVNDPPLFDLNGEDPGRDYSTSFTEEGPPVFLSSRDMTLIDVDNASLESVTVRITNLHDGDLEVLTLSGDFHYRFPTVCVDYNSGVLTVSGLGEVSNSTIQEDDSPPLDNQTKTQILCNSTVVNATCSLRSGSQPNTTAVSYTTAPMHHLVHRRSTPSWDLIGFQNVTNGTIVYDPAPYSTEYIENSPPVPITNPYVVLIEDNDDTMVQFSVTTTGILDSGFESVFPFQACFRFA